ncbi:Quinonprotein alcohol dehydrogenase-like superfamily [Tylopilus felleus]
MKHQNWVDSLAVTGDGTKIISSDSNDNVGRVKIWDVESHQLVREWIHPETFPKIAVSPDDQLIAVGYRTVVFYTIEGNQVNQAIDVDRPIPFMSFSPGAGSKLACSTPDDIRIYNVEYGTLSLGPLQSHSDHVHCVLWSHDASTLFSASEDETICCWSADTGKRIGEPWTGHTHGIRSLSLSPDGQILVSASLDTTARFWNAISGHPIGQHLRHAELEDVTAVCFSPSGERVVSVGRTGRIYAWQVPWLAVVEGQVRTVVECTSVFTHTSAFI